MKFRELADELKKEIKPAYFIYGGDAYLRNRAAECFKELIDPELLDFNVTTVLPNAPVSELVNACRTEPLISNLRLVIARDYKVNVSDEQTLIDYLVNDGFKTAVLVFIREDRDLAGAKLSRELIPVDCSHLEQRELAKIIFDDCTGSGYRIDSVAADMLAVYCNFDLFTIKSNLSKLFAYTNESKIIDIKAINEIVPVAADYQIYELSNAVADNDKQKAITILHNFLESGTPAALLYNLTSHFRRLLHVKLSDMTLSEFSTAFRAPEFAVKRNISAAKKYKQTELKSIVDRLCALEFEFKSGVMNDMNALHIGFFRALSPGGLNGI